MAAKKTAKEKVEVESTKNIAMNGVKSRRIYKSRGKKEMPIEEKATTNVASKQVNKKDINEVVKPMPAKENKTRKTKEKSSSKAENTGTKVTTKTTRKGKNKDKEVKKKLSKPKVTTKTTTEKTKAKVEKESKKAEPKQTKKVALETKAAKETKVEAEVKKETKQTKAKKAAKKQADAVPEIQETKPTVRYSDEDLEIFRNRILEVKREAIEELNMLRDRLEDLNSYDLAEEGSIYSMHMAEQGSEIFEKEKVYAQIQRINEYIKKLDEALQRINDKTYGICRVCGILIAKERLLAVPITTLSASYKIHKKCPEDGIDRIEPVGK